MTIQSTPASFSAQSYYINTPHNLNTLFAANTETTFRPDGSVSAGVLAQNATLYTNTPHTQSKQFSARTKITFRPDGSVASVG